MHTRRILTAAITCALALGLSQSALAVQNSRSDQDRAVAIKERERATSRALLGALADRRVAIAQARETEASRAALAFLDARIAELRRRVGR